MAGRKEQDDDRRENVRFKVEDNAIAVLGPLTQGLGELVELSTDGFSYLYHEDEQPLQEATETVTFFGEESLCLGEVHLTTVSDREVESNPIQGTTRRVGVKFGNLTTAQKKQLEHFIYKNAYFEV